VATVQSGNKAIKRAATNPMLEFLERLGYVARGALYAVMGLLALGVALGVGGSHATDLSGSLVFLIGNPFGKLVLIAFAIGLAAYSLWGFVRAIYDPLHPGVTPPAMRRGLASSPVQSPTRPSLSSLSRSSAGQAELPATALRKRSLQFSPARPATG
jgi:fumarate reductase subunit D